MIPKIYQRSRHFPRGQGKYQILKPHGQMNPPADNRKGEPFAKWAGAGATVPLLGFGNTLWKGVKEGIGEDGLLGIFKGGFTASSAGICGALVFGYLASLVFKPKMK